MLLDPSSPLARSYDDEGLLKGGVVACDELKRGCDVGDCVWEIQNGGALFRVLRIWMRYIERTELPGLMCAAIV